MIANLVSAYLRKLDYMLHANFPLPFIFSHSVSSPQAPYAVPGISLIDIDMRRVGASVRERRKKEAALRLARFLIRHLWADRANQKVIDLLGSF